ncbi:Olfactory receptor 2B11 [Heterocephalus glaber]|uniref:Olfactory receptor 2B11 n=1 Tax=Heterocephalus glaber TaxID=10181 RepID=G5AT67_HETGA|nr:Olfactory receptor 2B11 [Heterocephalus glaber]
MMDIDHYVAFCWPLQYTLIMCPWVCMQMAAACWSSGLANALLQETLTVQLPLCEYHTLDHFCETLALIKLACEGTSANDLALASGGMLFALKSSILLLFSYTFISRAILKLSSAIGRHKALSTCSSHLLVFSTYFGPAIYMYLQPPTHSTQTKFMSLFY